METTYQLLPADDCRDLMFRRRRLYIQCKNRVFATDTGQNQSSLAQYGKLYWHLITTLIVMLNYTQWWLEKNNWTLLKRTFLFYFAISCLLFVPLSSCSVNLFFPVTVKWRLLNLCLAAKVERSGQDTEHLDFKVMVEPKDVQPYTVILVASSRQEKSAWTSDISQVCVIKEWICSTQTHSRVVKCWFDLGMSRDKQPLDEGEFTH